MVIFGCPAHDERDYAFAKEYNIPIKCIIKGKEKELPYCETDEKDTLTNSEFLDQKNIKNAKETIIEKIEKNKIGQNYKIQVKRLGVSRQRYWGCPIPIIYREDGKILTVEDDELPIKLPEDIELDHLEILLKIIQTGKLQNALKLVWVQLEKQILLIHFLIHHGIF